MGILWGGDDLGEKCGNWFSGCLCPALLNNESDWAQMVRWVLAWQKRIALLFRLPLLATASNVRQPA